MRVRIARDELRRLRELTQAINAPQAEIAELVGQVAAQLLDEPGFGPLTAAKLVGEIAGAARFGADAKLARAAGLAPIPVSSGRTDRHRLDRGANRQTNRRHSPRRHHPRPPSPRNDRPPRAQQDRRQDPPPSDPVAQAPPRKTHLAAAARAPPAARNHSPPINFSTKEQHKQQHAGSARPGRSSQANPAVSEPLHGATARVMSRMDRSKALAVSLPQQQRLMPAVRRARMPLRIGK
jgi:hypothetical protein